MVQLATIGIDNTPRVRTVVFRGWSEFYEMEIYTDIRSQKINELNFNNNIEICWLFLSTKCQFRFRGTSTIDIGNDRQCHWNKLSEKSKAMWSWPAPGDHYMINKNDELKDKMQEKESSNFTLLKIDIANVDQLLLHKPFHTRRKWIRKNKWIQERINP